MPKPSFKHKPFAIRYDKANENYYATVPKHLRKEVGQERIFSDTKVELENELRPILGKYAHCLRRPAPRSAVDVLEDELRLLGCKDSLEMILRQKKDQFEMLQKLQDLGCPDTIDQILNTKRVELECVRDERTLEQFRDELADSLDPDKNPVPKAKRQKELKNWERRMKENGAQAKHIRLTPFPWKDKKLASFLNKRVREGAIEEVEDFLATQYNFLNGELWSPHTVNGWISRFNLIIDYAVGRQATELAGNFFRIALKRRVLEISPVIFELDKLQEFMTYVRYWYPELYVGLVLGTWGCIRVEEITRMTWDMINLTPGAGMISLPPHITKMKDDRTIYESEVPHLFDLLRAMFDPAVKRTERIMRTADWKNSLFFAYRELFGEPWSSNFMRSTGASALLVHYGMAVCGKVMGHQFEGVDEALLTWYRKHMLKADAERFMRMVPEPWSNELDARFKHKLYRGWTDCALSTYMWPNYQVLGQHTVGMGSTKMLELLRRKRPIFAEAKGRTVEITVTHLDGTSTTTTPPIDVGCAKRARKMVHRIRVASLTGQGVIDTETGIVTHYGRNYGPCLGQDLFKLTNGAELRRQMEERRMNVKDVAQQIGTSIDILCRYFKMGEPKVRPKHMPESHKIKLETLFTGLQFNKLDKAPSDVVGWICRGAPEDKFGCAASPKSL